MGNGIFGVEDRPDGILSIPPGISGAWLEQIVQALRGLHAGQEKRRSNLPPPMIGVRG